MKRTAILVAATALLVLGACSSTDGTAVPAPSVPASTSASSPSASTAAAPADAVSDAEFAETWDGKLNAFVGNPANTCALTEVHTSSCAEYLTNIVTTVSELDGEIKDRANASAYASSLAETKKILDAGESYGESQCMNGPHADGSGEDLCPSYVITITMGVVSLGARLQADSLNAN